MGHKIFRKRWRSENDHDNDTERYIPLPLGTSPFRDEPPIPTAVPPLASAPASAVNPATGNVNQSATMLPTPSGETVTVSPTTLPSETSPATRMGESGTLPDATVPTAGEVVSHSAVASPSTAMRFEGGDGVSELSPVPLSLRENFVPAPALIPSAISPLVERDRSSLLVSSHLPEEHTDPQSELLVDMYRTELSPVISVERVKKHYTVQRSADVVALDGITFDVYPGEFVFLVGASGSGKSTILRLLIKEETLDGGNIRVAGVDITALRKRAVPSLRRQIGTVFQDFRLLTDRTVVDNVAFTLKVLGWNNRDAYTAVNEVLTMVGLGDKGDRFPHELSGGEQQRAAIARAFVANPPVLIADEPTGNLDPETSQGIIALLHTINMTGTTVLMATHDSTIVNQMEKRVIELSAGKIVRDEHRGLYHEVVAN